MNGGAELLVEHLAEGEEVVDPRSWASARIAGPKRLPELHVRRAWSVSMRKPSTPNSSIQWRRCRPCPRPLAALGPQVVEAEEVAVERALPG
jgi:hypothetical protein